MCLYYADLCKIKGKINGKTFLFYESGVSMIILALILMAVSLIVFVLLNRQKEAIWLTGLFLGFALVNVGLMFFYSKMGGLAYNEQILFFLTTSIQETIQYSTLTLDAVARLFTIGKYMFVFFVLMFSLDLPGILKKKWWLSAVLFLWPLCSIVLLDPFLFRMQSYNGRMTVNFLGRACTAIYITVSMIFLAKEYLSHNIRWVKKQLRYIILFVLNLIVYFVFFGRLNPVNIFSSESYDLLNFGTQIYRLRFSLNAWVFVIGLFLFFIIVGLIALFQYAKVNLAENRSEISLERQLDTANMGTRVFIHGMKNQLFAEKILLRQMTQQLQEKQADLEVISNNIEDLNRINENMLSRIEALYKVFKYNSMVLVPCNLSQVVELSLKKAQKKIGDIECKVNVALDSVILADLDYLSEALYNILINAVDAILASERAAQGKIEISLKNDSYWCAIRVDDNGIGIEKSKINRIFEPFYTDKNTNYSWGIGLSYVKQIVKYHFGKLHVDSKVGECTTLVMAFPKYSEIKEYSKPADL